MSHKANPPKEEYRRLQLTRTRCSGCFGSPAEKSPPYRAGLGSVVPKRYCSRNSNRPPVSKKSTIVQAFFFLAFFVVRFLDAFTAFLAFRLAIFFPDFFGTTNKHGPLSSVHSSSSPLPPGLLNFAPVLAAL